MNKSERTPWDGLVLGATLVTLDCDSGYGLVEDGALGWRDGVIVHAGPRTALPADPNSLSGTVIDLGGGLVTPGLVDCHTHLVFAGNRAGEFEQRLQGAARTRRPDCRQRPGGCGSPPGPALPGRRQGR